jgi:hypothetical protein
VIRRLFVGGPAHGRVIGVTGEHRITYPYLSADGYGEGTYRAERFTVTEFTCSGLTIPIAQWRVRTAVWTVFVTGPLEDIPMDRVAAMCRAEMLPPDKVVERVPTTEEIAIETERLTRAAYRPR